MAQILASAVNLPVTMLGDPISWIAASADGHKFVNNGDTLIYVDMSLAASPSTWKLLEQALCDFGHDHTVIDELNYPEVLASASGWNRLHFAQHQFRWNSPTGYAYFTLSNITDVKCAAVNYYGRG